MKCVYIIQNSQLSFEMDLSKIYSPNKYILFFITNHFSLEKLKKRNQEHYFEKIWLTEDFSFESLRNIIKTNQEKIKLPFNIVTHAEESVLVCGRLRNFFNVDQANYDRFINKILMKQLIEKAGLLYPKYMQFYAKSYIENPENYLKHIIKTLQFPIIAKPVDAYGCIGIEKIFDAKRLKMWCDSHCSTDSTFELDEFIDGKVYNCDSYVKNNKIIFTQVSECSNSCFDFICGLTKGTIALPHDDHLYKSLCDYTVKIHQAIGAPQAGVTHLEVILTAENQLYFLEIAHRSPGILIPAMYKKFLNIGTVESHILLQIDNEYALPIQQGSYCAWVAFPKIKGRLIKKYNPKISSDYELEWISEIGDQMEAVSCGRDYAGRLLLWNNDYQQLKKDFYYLCMFQFFDVDR